MRQKKITSWEQVPLIIDVAYASLLLGVCEVTVRRLIRDGKLKAVKIGEAWKINKADIKDFMNAKENVA